MTLIKTLIPQDEFTGFYLLKELEVKQTNGNPPKDYMDLVLGDSSGQLPAKYWDVSPTDKETFFPMTLVKVKGIVQLYREKPQVKVLRIRPVTEEDGVQLSEFIRSAPISSDDLMATIRTVTASIEDEELRSMVAFCIGKVEEKLVHYPAAKTHHHAYYGGLAYHMVRMLEIGEFVCRQRPFLRPDLLKAGILLHDIAKPVEMEAEMGIVTDYSVYGKLIGHIALASSWITEAAIRTGIGLDSPKVLALQHLILSHHNTLEWGSPVQPQLPEAVALHHIDSMDAKLQMVEDALSVTPDSEQWTAPIRGLENKPIHRLVLE